MIQHFNSIVPSKPIIKVRNLRLNTALCDQNFLTSQTVQIRSTTSSTLTLETPVPPGLCVLSPLLYSPFTHDYVDTHSSKAIIKFADDTTVDKIIKQPADRRSEP